MSYDYSPIKGLIESAREVITNWESGDLAGAVRELQEALLVCEEDIQYTKDNKAVVEKAAETYCSNDIEIDDCPCISRGADGYFVSAWVFVPEEEETKS